MSNCEENLQKMSTSLQNIEKILNQMMLSQSGHTFINGNVTPTIADKESISGMLKEIKIPLDSAFNVGN
jgi:hypothetical protein